MLQSLDSFKMIVPRISKEEAAIRIQKMYRGRIVRKQNLSKMRKYDFKNLTMVIINQQRVTVSIGLKNDEVWTLSFHVQTRRGVSKSFTVSLPKPVEYSYLRENVVKILKHIGEKQKTSDTDLTKLIAEGFTTDSSWQQLSSSSYDDYDRSKLELDTQ